MILEVRRLSIGYRNRVVGSDLTLSLAPGRVLALLGPNGGGKTTLLKTVLGLLPPLGGEVWLDGRRIQDWSVRERAHRLAYVPQVHAGTFGFSVEDVVMMGRTARGSILSAPSDLDREHVARAMDRLGLSSFRGRSYTEISGGERQLVLLARALAQEPSAIVLDEPTASLDFSNQGKVLHILRTLAEEGYGVLFTTHDPNHALRHADQVIMLRDGHILFHGPVDMAITRERLSALYASEVAQIGEGRDRVYLPQ